MAKRLNKLSLKTWLVIVFAVSVVISLVLILFINSMIDRLHSSLIETVELPPDSVDIKNGFYSVQVNVDGSITYVASIVENAGLYNFLGFMLNATPLLIAATGILITALLFYQFKLKKPIHALRDGISHIEKQDLNFSIDYRSEDELGALCRAFDSMRKKLNEAFLSLWDEQEKKTLLTHALAHDLRTPLTILKGHNDLIKISLQNNEINLQQLAGTNKIMGENIYRMEQYLDNVRDMQALEDWELHQQTILIQNIIDNINAMNILRKEIVLKVEGKGDCSIKVDLSLVMRVIENLVYNAMEYADRSVTISVESIDQNLWVCVTDDGKGFSADALQQAADPFYRSDMTRKGNHMGLGLSITKILSEKHGGDFKWGNTGTGAYAKVSFRSL